jgi:hypothetical protein
MADSANFALPFQLPSPGRIDFVCNLLMPLPHQDWKKKVIHHHCLSCLGPFKHRFNITDHIGKGRAI